MATMKFIKMGLYSYQLSANYTTLFINKVYMYPNSLIFHIQFIHVDTLDGLTEEVIDSYEWCIIPIGSGSSNNIGSVVSSSDK